MLNTLLEQAKTGQSLWLDQLRETFSTLEGVSLVLRLHSFDGAVRDYRHQIPRWENEEEGQFVLEYLAASVYNALSVCGGCRVTFFTDLADPAVTGLLDRLPLLFQLDSPQRRGLGKVINIADRLGRAFGQGKFSFVRAELRDYVPASPPVRSAASPVERLRALCQRAEGVNCVGIDVGGSDIKLAASRQGRLVAVKEYDWNPARFPRVEDLIDPILLLTRLMRACLAWEDPALDRALRKEATWEEMAAAVELAESRCEVNILDGIGVSFPDLVLEDRIVGGETPKTEGVRRHAQDYEAEFAKLRELKERLLPLCRGQGLCHIINDGSMAAFTAAVELAAGEAPERVDKGVIAHSLGTDLGTGVLDPAGKVPQLPLELYDTWVDLGSRPAAAYPPQDLRATRNENSGLPGARRYLGQEGVYRLAWELDPHLLEGFTQEKDGILRVPTAPEDLRKPCLAHLMEKAQQGEEKCQEIFRQVGRNLGWVSRELIYLLHPQAPSRWLFGRFVKSERCFALMQEGFQEVLPQIRLENGGEGLANTPLMGQLSRREDATVAQFAQAVGAIYYALT